MGGEEGRGEESRATTWQPASCIDSVVAVAGCGPLYFVVQWLTACGLLLGGEKQRAGPGTSVQSINQSVGQSSHLTPPELLAE